MRGATVPPRLAHFGRLVTLATDPAGKNDVTRHLAHLFGKRFELLRRLGEGGMGVVWEAYDRERRTRVALKMLPDERSASGLLRLKTEFRALQDVHHPNLVLLHELLEDDGDWFFTMELVQGTDFLSYVRGDAHATAGAPEHTTRVRRAHADALAPTTDMTGVVRAHREAPPADPARLRDALGQLASGLCALHRAGKVHCDVKPPNVLVTASGRVVLLDFGLVTDLARRAASDDLQISGTVAYMAPEQAGARPIGPAADWYAVGAVLYEALTGQVPFVGAPFDVLVRKQRAEPPPPRAIAPGVPTDLDALCVQLLRLDPAARPAGAAVLARLGVEGSPAVDPPATNATPSIPPFVGRGDERLALADAFAEAQRGRTVRVLVEGESGIGKTALVRRFVASLEAERRDAIVLEGRCHERESVPFKGVDGVVDALSRHLRRTPGDLLADVNPRNAGLLAQAFPVLEQVDVIAELRRSAFDVPIDPKERRACLFQAVRDLVARVAASRPVVIVIDDLQWTDDDSLALLSELVRPPDAPALLLIATLRCEASAGDVPARAATALGGGEVRRITLGALADEDGRSLAALLAERVAGAASAGSQPDPARIAQTAAGHPLFIDELVRHWIRHDDRPPAPSLDDALWARVTRLDRVARRLLETVAVAGAAIDVDVACEAADAGAGSDRALSLLRAERLVRTTALGTRQEVEPYHDRVREAVIHRLGGDARREAHRGIAIVLEWREAPNPESLCTHWVGAGEPAKAAAYAVRAAERASAALAFVRAARFYAQALELAPQHDARARELRVRRADALAHAGRGREAAETYLSARDGATTREKVRLERLAAEQLLWTGHVDDGLQAIRGVLDAVGVRLPATRRAAILSLLRGRAEAALRRARFRPRAERDVAPDDLTRIDACWAVVRGLRKVDPLRASDFHTRHLVFALRAGEPSRVVRALAAEAGFLANFGGSGRRRAAALLERCEPMARDLGEPYAIGSIVMSRGAVAYFDGRFRDARVHLAEATRIFEAECVAVPWDVESARYLLLRSLLALGDVRELAGRVGPCLRDADERDDLHAKTSLRTSAMHFVLLARGEPHEARRVAADAFAAWRGAGFSLQHYMHLVAQVETDLYLGDGAGAHARLEAQWPAVKGAFFLRSQLTRIWALSLRARAALAAGRVDEAEQEAARIEDEKAPWGLPLAHLVRGGVAVARGDQRRARASLVSAVARFDEAGMALHAAMARLRLAAAGGDDDARAAHEWCRHHGIREPDRLAAMIAPGTDRVVG